VKDTGRKLSAFLYIILRGHWCDIIVFNIHAPPEDKIDDVKNSFYWELEGIFDKFLKYNMKILLGGFNAEIRKTISIKQLGMRVLIKLLMIMEVE
jgi:hypothetical protein